MLHHLGWLSIYSGLTTSSTYHSDSIIQKGLPKDNYVEIFVDMDFFKDGQNSDRVDSTDEGGKDKAVKKFQFQADGTSTDQGKPIQAEANQEHVEDGAQHGKQQNGSDVIKEGTVWHEVPCI